MTSFLFFKKIDPNHLVTRSKPETRVLDQARFENYGPKPIGNGVFGCRGGGRII